MNQNILKTRRKIRHTNYTLSLFQDNFSNSFLVRKNKNIYLYSLIFSFTINYEYIIRNKNKPTACQYRTDRTIWQRKQLEVDFVINEGSQKYYIQSALAMPDEEKRKQEMASLLRIGDSFKKIIIVKDDIKPWTDENGILTMGLMDFLMGDTKNLNI